MDCATLLDGNTSRLRCALDLLGLARAGPSPAPTADRGGILRKAGTCPQDKVGGLPLPHQGSLTPEMLQGTLTGTSEHTPWRTEKLAT